MPLFAVPYSTIIAQLYLCILRLHEDPLIVRLTTRP